MRTPKALICLVGLLAVTPALAAGGAPKGGKGAAPEAPQNVAEDKKDGVIKPPANVDPNMATKPPAHVGTMPVIPPPTEKNGRKIVPK